MIGILSLLSKVPPIVYVLLALGGWGAYQKHQASSKAEELRLEQSAQAEAKAKALQQSLDEVSRRLQAQKEVTNRANKKASKAVAAAASASNSLELLRLSAAAAAARANASSAPSTSPSEANLLANALTRCGEEYQRVAAIADSAIVAGQTCEESYESLTKGEPE